MALTEAQLSKIVIDQSTGCLLWQGLTTKHGYGIGRVNGKQSNLHRAIYQVWTGETLSPETTLDHKCRRRNCLAPAHLEPVTQRVNNLRSTSPSSMNARKTECIRGHAFTPENTKWIKGKHGSKRQCRECTRASDRERLRRKKLEKIA